MQTETFVTKKHLFVGGPWDGKVLELEDDGSNYITAIMDTQESHRYYRHAMSLSGPNLFLEWDFFLHDKHVVDDHNEILVKLYSVRDLL